MFQSIFTWGRGEGKCVFSYKYLKQIRKRYVQILIKSLIRILISEEYFVLGLFKCRFVIFRLPNLIRYQFSIKQCQNQSNKKTKVIDKCITKCITSQYKVNMLINNCQHKSAKAKGDKFITLPYSFDFINPIGKTTFIHL